MGPMPDSTRVAPEYRRHKHANNGKLATLKVSGIGLLNTITTPFTVQTSGAMLGNASTRTVSVPGWWSIA